MYFLSQIRFLRNIHAGDVSKDLVPWFHLSYLRLPQGCLELAGFYRGCSRVGECMH